MSLTRCISSVTHRPAVLVFDSKGHEVIVATGCGLGVFAGLRLPRRQAAGEDAAGDGPPED